MWTEHQKNYLKANIYNETLIVGQSALVNNGLMYGPCGLVVLAYDESLHGIRLGDVFLEYFHFTDGHYCTEIDREHKVWLPTPERALVDTMFFIDKNYIEGPLIESLQDYLSRHDDLTELRSVASFYGLKNDVLNYWINEALNESDMSMG